MPRLHVVRLVPFGLLTVVSLGAAGCLPVVAGAVLGILGALEEDTQAPVVAVGSIARTSAPEMAIPLTVFDGDGDRVTLRLEYRTDDDSTWRVATTSPAHVDATPQGVTLDLMWSAAADLTTGISYRDDIDLRITPRDADDTGNTVVVHEVEYGNDRPLIPSFEVELREDGFVHGIVRLTLSLQDSAADFVELDGFELVLPELGGGEVVEVIDVNSENFPIGTFTEMGTQVAPGEFVHTLGWNASAALQANVLNAYARVRVRELDTDVPLASTWTESQTFHLRTQTPPLVHIQEITLPDGGGELSGPTGIFYTLFDEQGDVSDVEFQYSVDGGATWRRCTEYRTPFSEGRTDLAAQPAALGGVRHKFYWDTRADTIASRSDVLLRLIPADSHGTGQPAEALMPLTVGADSQTPVYALLPDQATPDETRRIALAHLATDENPYLVVLYHEARTGEDDIHTLRTYPTQGSLPNTNVWTGSFAASHTGEIEHLSDEAVAHLLLADVTGNGFDDAVYVWADGLVEVFEADGAGSFALTPSTTNIGSSVLDGFARAADMNGNDRPDLVLVTNGGAGHDIEVWLNDNGNGSFVQLFAQTATAGAVLAMTTADMTGTGDEDLVVVSSEAGNTMLRVFENLGSGTFDSPVQTNLGASDNSIRAIAAADFTGNGNLDLALGSTSTWFGVRVYEGLGDGEVDAEPALTENVQMREFAALDITKDGRLDLVGYFGTTVRVLANTGTEELMALPPLTMAQSGHQLAYADFHDEGDVSLVVRTLQGYQVAVAVGRRASGRGHFGEPSVVGNFAVWDFQIGDFNRNGILDFASVSGNNQLRINWGKAAGGFATQPRILTLNENAHGLLKGDFNGDGHLELLVLHQSQINSSITPIEFNALGEPVPGTPVATGTIGMQYPAFVKDLNGNGHLDIIASGIAFGVPVSTPYVHVLLNDGNGNFTADQSYPGIQLIAVADLTANGVYDFLAANQGGSELYIMEGQGDGKFDGGLQNPVISGVTPAVETVVIADVNDNGVLDIVFADATGGMIHTAKGNEVNGVAQGTYDPQQSEPFPAVASLVAGDFTGDGHLDLIGGETTNRSVLARGFPQHSLQGSWNWPVFIQYEHPALAGSTVMLRVADVNYDGLPDLVGITQGNQVFVRYGRVGPRQSSFAHRSLPDANVTAASLNEPRTLRHPAQSEEYVPGINLQRYGGAYSDGIGPASETATLGASQFQHQLARHASHDPGFSLPDGLTPVTHAWMAQGDQRITAIGEWFDDGGVSVFIERHRIENRLGARLEPQSETNFEREGLDLAATPERGVILDLAVRPGEELSMQDEIVVYMRVRDWHRHDGSTSPYLPLIPIIDPASQVVVDFRTEYRERWTWIELEQAQNNDFSEPSDEPRFRLDPDHPEGARIQVLTDRLGVLQAYRIVGQ